MSEPSTFSIGFHYQPGAVGYLRGLLPSVRYKPGWEFSIVSYGGFSSALALKIRVPTVDSSDGLSPFLADHTLPIPPAYWDQAEWERWLLEQILLVERHEACEFFTIGDERPFFPMHGLEGSPYEVRRRDA